MSPISPLNAFDEALMAAGIAQCNLVPVSSILPANAVEVGYVPITPGAVTYVVMAKAEGKEGETISAGVAWAFGVTEDGVRYGLVAEAHGYSTGEKLKLELQKRLFRMAEIRGMKLGKPRYRVETIEEIPKGMFGSALAVLVFVPYIDYRKVKEAES